MAMWHLSGFCERDSTYDSEGQDRADIRVRVQGPNEREDKLHKAKEDMKLISIVTSRIIKNSPERRTFCRLDSVGGGVGADWRRD